MKKKSRTIVVKYSLWSRTHYVSCLSHSYLSLVYSTNLPSNKEIGENERKEIRQKRRKRGKWGKRISLLDNGPKYLVGCVIQKRRWTLLLCIISWRLLIITKRIFTPSPLADMMMISSFLNGCWEVKTSARIGTHFCGVRRSWYIQLFSLLFLVCIVGLGLRYLKNREKGFFFHFPPYSDDFAKWSLANF